MEFIKPILAGVGTFIIILCGSIFFTQNMSNESTILFAISITCGLIIACSIWIVDIIKKDFKVKR